MNPLLLPVIFAASLAGCAQLGDTKATEGAAVYKLKSPQCEVEIVSGRVFGGGNLNVGKDCSINATVDTVEAAQTLELIRTLLGIAP